MGHGAASAKVPAPAWVVGVVPFPEVLSGSCRVSMGLRGESKNSFEVCFLICSCCPSSQQGAVLCARRGCKRCLRDVSCLVFLAVGALCRGKTIKAMQDCPLLNLTRAVRGKQEVSMVAGKWEPGSQPPTYMTPRHGGCGSTAGMSSGYLG